MRSSEGELREVRDMLLVLCVWKCGKIATRLLYLNYAAYAAIYTTMLLIKNRIPDYYKTFAASTYSHFFANDKINIIY